METVAIRKAGYAKKLTWQTIFDRFLSLARGNVIKSSHNVS